MRFYEILCPRSSPAPENSSCTVIQGYFSVVSRRFYPSEMYIMSQSLLSYLRIDTLSPSAPTAERTHTKRVTETVHTWRRDTWKGCTHGEGTHTERVYTQSGYTHGEGIHGEGTHTRRGDTHGEGTHTERRHTEKRLHREGTTQREQTRRGNTRRGGAYG